MATRLHFPETEAAAVSPAIQGTYGHTNTLRRRLLSTPDSSTLTTTAYTPDASDHLVAGAAHHRQYVSDQIPSARTISGTWRMQIQALEGHAANNQALDVMIFVCSSDGATIKETLFAQAAAASEFHTALRNITMSGSITSAEVEQNDRIVVQVGSSGTPTASGGTQGHNTSLRWGCNASSGDLPEDETQTGTTYRAWIEFSADMFATPYSADLSAPAVAVTPQDLTRFNAYAGQLSTRSFALAGQDLTRLNAYAGQLSAPSFGLTALDLAWDVAVGYAADLSAAACSFTAQAFERFNDYVGELTVAGVTMAGHALDYIQDTIMDLDYAVMAMTGRDLTWTADDGVIQRRQKEVYLSTRHSGVLCKRNTAT